MTTKSYFHTRNNRPATIPCEAGREFANTYEVTIDDNGHKTLSKNGETNTYAEIQSHLEGTLIQNIIERATLGDEEALNARKALYVDATEYPKTLAEAQKMVIDMRNKFENLPLEIKEKFDFSAEKFINDFGTESFNKAMGMIETAPGLEPTVEPTTVEPAKTEGNTNE